MTLRWLALLLLAVTLFAIFAEAEDTWSGIDRIVAVGDLHGDYDACITVLRSAGLIDEKTKWSGGKTHLVITGDVLDRGPDSRKILDLLIQLEKKARSDGGYVHFLIGNHEAMNVYGDLRYASAAEYEAFRTGNSSLLRDELYKQHLEETRQPANPGDAYRKEWDKQHPLGFVEHRIEFGPNGKYGQRIRKQNVIVKINDLLFMHAGLSPKYVTYTIREINERIRKELNDFKKLEGGFTLDDKEGPLWFRGLAQEDNDGIRAHVDAQLQTYGVSRIVIGHTPTGGVILPRFGGKVLSIDVGLSRVYGGPPSCLVFEKGIPHVIHRGQRIEFPGPNGVEILAYLKKVAALEPEGSPVHKHVADVEAQLAGMAPAHERISFPTQDGGLVHADVYGKGERAVVLAHGGRFTKESWKDQAQALAAAGFRALAFDFRGEDHPVRFDVLAAVGYLRRTGAKTVSIVGASFGGDAAAEAMAEAEPGEIDRLVLLAHGAYGPPEKLTGRKLFIVSRDDANTAGVRLPRIRAQYEQAPEPKKLVILEGSAHAQFLFGTDQAERLMHEILQFLAAP